MFSDYGEFSRIQKEVINRLAIIEEQDAEACRGCGGEDCMCCEIYHDRRSWRPASELLLELEDF